MKKLFYIFIFLGIVAVALVAYESNPYLNANPIQVQRIEEKAIVERNPLLCEKLRYDFMYTIGDRESSANCLRIVSAGLKEVSPCAGLTYMTGGGQCYAGVALSTKDDSLCAKITYQDSCRAAVAAYKAGDCSNNKCYYVGY